MAKTTLDIVLPRQGNTKELDMGDKPLIEEKQPSSLVTGNLLKLSTKQVVGGSSFEVFGFDISYIQRDHQFLVCLIGFLVFSLCYGYLQELLSVHVFSRKMTLFLSTVQFAGYTGFCSLLRSITTAEALIADRPSKLPLQRQDVPKQKYIALAFLRAFELGLTNLSLAYLNFPAKTLLKSSRVVSTMLVGSWLQQKSYRAEDMGAVGCMIIGLCLFLRADANSETVVFHWFGVLLLLISNLFDGAILNFSEGIMNEYSVPQDEFIFEVYSLATCAVAVAAAMVGELDEGVLWMSNSGTYQEFLLDEPASSWSVPGKWTVVLLFGFSGYLALYFSQTLIKHFGALTMSITNTCRRATTLFLSFCLFDNVLTVAHLLGIFVFAIGLYGKVLLLQFSTRPRTLHFSWFKTQTVVKRKISGLESATKDVPQEQTDFDISEGLPMHRTRQCADKNVPMEPSLTNEDV